MTVAPLDSARSRAGSDGRSDRGPGFGLAPQPRASGFKGLPQAVNTRMDSKRSEPAEDAQNPEPPEGRRAGSRATLIVLLASAAALFAAGMHTLSLPSFDDALYARWGVEMARSGGSFTVTRMGEPEFAKPPLQFWLLAVSFGLLGENDAAARLPSLLMACATLLLVFRLGSRLFDERTGLTAAALLVVTPYFVENARGSMLDLPLAFWICVSMTLFVEGRRRPRLHVAAALPLAAGILTKSVLGLLPVAIMAALCLHPHWRPRRMAPLALGAVLGLSLGATWTVDQWFRFGSEFVIKHYWDEFGGRAVREFDVAAIAIAYPLLLLQHFQPIVIPGLLGAAGPIRNLRRAAPGELLLAAWVLLPIVLCAVSAQAQRYVFPILPPLALCASVWLRRALPTVERHLAARIAPAVALAAAAVFAFSPATLTRDVNGAFKRNAGLIRERAPERLPIPYHGDGDRYWQFSNALEYYAERTLAPGEDDPRDALAAAREHPGRLLLCERERLAEVEAVGRPVRTVVEGPRWVLLEVF